MDRNHLPPAEGSFQEIACAIFLETLKIITATSVKIRAKKCLYFFATDYTDCTDFFLQKSAFLISEVSEVSVPKMSLPFFLFLRRRRNIPSEISTLIS